MAVEVQPVPGAADPEYYDVYFFYTPTYIIACVAAGFLIISILIERFLHHLGKVRGGEGRLRTVTAQHCTVTEQ